MAPIGCGARPKAAEESVLLEIYAGSGADSSGEVEYGGDAAVVSVAEFQRPETVDGYRVAAGVVEQTTELAADRIEGADVPRPVETSRAMAEVTDQQGFAEFTEFRRCKRDAPWTVERAAGCQPLDAVSVRVVDVHSNR